MLYEVITDVDSFSGDSSPAMAKRILKLTDRFIVHNQVSLLRLSEVLVSLGLDKPIQVIPHGHYLDNVTAIGSAPQVGEAPRSSGKTARQ